MNNVGIPPPGRVRVGGGGGAYFPRLGREKDLLGREGAGPRDPLPTEQISSQQAIGATSFRPLRQTYIQYVLQGQAPSGSCKEQLEKWY